MTKPTHEHDAERLERSLRVWLTEGRPTLAARDSHIDAVLDSLDDTPRARARFLGRWLDRGGGARRGTDVHDHPPNTNRRNRLMFSATGLAAAFAILALSVNVIDTDPPPPAAEGPRTHGVAANGSAEYTSIQTAVDAAADGDTIFIQPGTYNESVFVDKDLTVVGGGGGPGAVIVHIPDDGPSRPFGFMNLKFGFWFEDATAEISNISISGPSAKVSALVAVGGDLFAHDLVEDLDPYTRWPYGFLYMRGDATGVIQGNDSKAFVWLDDEASPTIRQNTIHNVIRSDGDSAPHITENDVGGVWVRGNAAPVIEGNLIDYANNGEADGGFSSCGIEAREGTTRPTIVDNEILNAPFGICVLSGEPVEIRDNTLGGNGIVAISLSSSDTTVAGNRITGESAGIQLGAGSPTVTGNTIDVGGRGIAIGARSTATIDGNTVCGGSTSIHAVEGAEPTLGDNELC